VRVSVQAITWLLEDAPDMPPHLVGTALGLANHADRHGKGSYPGQATLAWYARKSDRAVRKDLKDLLTLKLIRLGDQRLVHHIPADERPVVYDLAMERKREQPAKKDRNQSSARTEEGTGTTVPAQRRGDDQKGPEPQFPPINGRDRNHSSAPVNGGTGTVAQRDRNYSVRGTGTVVPTNRPLTVLEPLLQRSPTVSGRVAAALGIEEEEAERVVQLVIAERHPGVPSRYVAALIDSGDIHSFLQRVRSPEPTVPAYAGPTHRFDDNGYGDCTHCPLPEDHPCHPNMSTTGASA
jgi:hypothetical protein